MSNFDTCHEITAKWEGGWSDHSKDPGGKTNWGVTQATLSKHLGRPATATEIRNLTKADARNIYKNMFWDVVGGDELPPGVNLCVYDFGVNSGPSRGVKSLQTALGVPADGWVGEKTYKAAAKANKRELINTLCDRRLAFMRSIRDKDTGAKLWDTFGKGWQRRVEDIRKRALAMVGSGVAQPLGLLDVPDEGTAKALPAPPVEQSISTEQKIGGGAGLATIIATPIASFWRENSDLFTNPVFIVVVVILVAIVGVLVFRKPKLVENMS